MAILTPEKFEDLNRDIEDTGKAINIIGIITPRYGEAFKSLPLVSKEAENRGGFISAPTLTALQAIVPTYNYQLARVDDTGDEYRWNPALTSTVKWEATGRNFLSESKQYIDENILYLVDLYAQKENVTSSDVLIAVTDKDGVRTWLEVAKDGGMTVSAKETVKAAVTPSAVSDELLFAVTDKNGVATSLSVKKDGSFSEVAINDIKGRLGNISASINAFSDTTKMSVWGSSTIENSHSYWVQLAADLGISNIWLGGKGAETAEVTCARQGSIPALLIFQDSVIKGSTDQQAVTPTNLYVNQFVGAENMKSYSGTVNGIHGTLSYKSANPTQLWFKRDSAGTDIIVDASTEYPFTPDAVSYQNSICVLNIGKNNLNFEAGDYSLPSYVLECTKKAYAFCKPFYKFVLVMGHFVNTEDTDAMRDRTMACNDLLKQEFGERYFDLHGYLMSKQVWIDTGITPTPTDLTQQANNRKPSSLSLDNLHMNDAANNAVILKEVKNLMISYGWYNTLSS